MINKTELIQQKYGKGRSGKKLSEIAAEFSVSTTLVSLALRPFRSTTASQVMWNRYPTRKLNIGLARTESTQGCENCQNHFEPDWYVYRWRGKWVCALCIRQLTSHGYTDADLY
jgi:hypothetical protein